MHCRLTGRWWWWTRPFWLAAGLAVFTGLAAASAPTGSTPAAVITIAPSATPPLSAPEQLKLDNWQSYLESPATPSRSHMFKGDDGNAPMPKAETPEPATTAAPISISTKPADSRPPLALKPKPGSDDDRLAAIALEDRDFFQALAKNPEEWPEAERNRRAQLLHDEYWIYIVEYPDDVNAVILYGKLLSHVGQRDAAFATFEHADALDPKIAVVKQQLANHQAEDGHYAAALDLFRQAEKLEPSQPVYHYETAELLDFFYEEFLKDKIFDEATLNRTMEVEFARAMELAPQTPAFAWRHAECYYDMFNPDWNAALGAWDGLAARMTDPLESEVIRLHRARILIELARFDDARALLAQPVRESLEPIRVALGQRLAAATAPKAAPPAATAPEIPSAGPAETQPAGAPKPAS